MKMFVKFQHRLIEEEARNAVLEMICRAERLAMEREMRRIAEEATMMHEEGEEMLNEEARDRLGVYGGPATNKYF